LNKKSRKISQTLQSGSADLCPKRTLSMIKKFVNIKKIILKFFFFISLPMVPPMFETRSGGDVFMTSMLSEYARSAYNKYKLSADLAIT